MLFVHLIRLKKSDGSSSIEDVAVVLSRNSRARQRFAFHTVNAWQQPNPSGSEDIICDLLEYPNLDITHKFYYSNLMSSAQDSAPRSNEKGNTSRPRLARYALRNTQQHNLTDSDAILRPHPQAELLTCFT
jgi:hypothetical protein